MGPGGRDRLREVRLQMKFRSRPLKDQFQRQLNLSRGIGLIANHSEVRCPVDQTGNAKARMIRNVVELAAKLQVESLAAAKGIIFIDSEIEIVYAIHPRVRQRSGGVAIS